MKLVYDEQRGVYYDATNDARGLDQYWTLFCGDDGEEIDVAAAGELTARELGRLAIAKDYEPMLIDRAERRYRGLTYF